MEADQRIANYFSKEWCQDEQGFLHRQAARVVAVNDREEVLLVKGHDFSDCSHWWWFTVGGGLKAGESPREGAVREFFEETGYQLDSGNLTGPVWRRHAVFKFRRVTCKQDELFFFTRIPGCPLMNTQHHTETEKQLLDGFKWWNLDDLEREVARGSTVYPVDFVALTRQCLKGWNHVMVEISDKDCS